MEVRGTEVVVGVEGSGVLVALLHAMKRGNINKSMNRLIQNRLISCIGVNDIVGITANHIELVHMFLDNVIRTKLHEQRRTDPHNCGIVQRADDREHYTGREIHGRDEIGKRSNG
jgi:hypothetical protein